MTNILKNKWKILSFALAGFIVLGALVPQANATTDISQIVQKIYNIVASPDYGNQAIKNAIGNGASQTSVNNLQSTLSSVQTTVNNEKPLALVINKTLTIPKNTGQPWVTLLPNSAGKTYSGHISLHSNGDGDTGALVACFYGDGQADWFYLGSARSYDSSFVNIDFSCLSLRLNPFNDSTDHSEDADLVGVVQYQVSTSITQIS